MTASRPSLDTLRAVLAELRASPLAGRIRVFGSVAAAAPTPSDLDCVLDLDTPSWVGEARVASWRERPGTDQLDPATSAALQSLLAIRRDPRYRDALDLFVRVRGVIVMPSEDGTWWRPHPHGPSVWAKGRDRGVPLAAISTIPLPADPRGVRR